jgi:hypothetical protein
LPYFSPFLGLGDWQSCAAGATDDDFSERTSFNRGASVSDLLGRKLTSSHPVYADQNQST